MAVIGPFNNVPTGSVYAVQSTGVNGDLVLAPFPAAPSSNAAGPSGAIQWNATGGAPYGYTGLMWIPTGTSGVGGLVLGASGSYLAIGTGPAQSGDIRLYQGGIIKGSDTSGGDLPIIGTSSIYGDYLFIGTEDNFTTQFGSIALYGAGAVYAGNGGTTRLALTAAGVQVYNLGDPLIFGYAGAAGSGDIRGQGTLTIRVPQAGLGDCTVFQAVGDSLYIGTDSDDISHAMGVISMYPFSTIAMGIADVTYLYMNTTAQEVQIYGSTVLSFGNGITTPASTGRLRLSNTDAIKSNNEDGSADINLITTDTSNDILIGDTTNPPTTYIYSANTVALAPGSAFFEITSNGLCLLSQSTHAPGGTSYAQFWADTNSRLWNTDASSNQLTCNKFAVSLANNAVTSANALTNVVNSTTSATLQVSVAATDTVRVRFTGTAICSSSGGIKFGFAIPTSATIEGFAIGMSSSSSVMNSSRISAGSTASVTLLNVNAVGWFQLEATVKMDGSHSGTITPMFLAVTNPQTATIEAGATLECTWLNTV